MGWNLNGVYIVRFVFLLNLIRLGSSHTSVFYPLQGTH